MANTPEGARTQLDDFFNNIDTLPKLIGDLANSVGEAQKRMDQGYLDNLAEFRRVVSSVLDAAPGRAEELMTLFKDMGPTRQSITETALEVHVDMQLSSASDLSIGGTLGITVPFTVTVNASYERRTAMNVSAAAVVKTTINAIPASPAVMAALLPRAGEPISLEEPKTNQGLALLDSMKAVAGTIQSPPR